MRHQCDSMLENWQTLTKQQAFVRALWSYKRRERTEEPTAQEFGLCKTTAEGLARHVQFEFEQQVLKKVAA